MLIKNRDFVIFGLQQWYTPIGSNCKNIALQLAKHNRVLYVNSPLDRNTIMQSKNDPNIEYHLKATKGEVPDIVPISDNLWNYYPPTKLESINWLPSTTVFQWFNKMNNKRFSADLKKAIGKMGFKDVIIFNDNDMFRGYYVKDMVKPSAYVYYSRDYLLGVDYWKKHGSVLEPRHIAKADVAVANSLYLADMLKQYNQRSYYVGQGCDLTLFDANDQHPLPAALEPLPHPMIGYVGALNTLRLDISILKKIAMANPKWSLVLVGPEDETFKSSDLHEMDNVHFLGRKEVKDLPSYIHAFDVCINPQLVNPVTIGNYPLKIDEYLAMGKPVVATRTKTMSLFEDHVYLADKPEDYVNLVKQAVQENNEEKKAQRISFAQSHSWENSVAEIYKAIHSHQNEH